uniref:Solute carrier family 35 member B4 n=1 Tax=Pavo cristatus TaxID=9049 RepID=A0A8C9L769_PAVCR
MHPAVAVCLVFCGCCSNVVFLELLILVPKTPGLISPFLIVEVRLPFPCRRLSARNSIMLTFCFVFLSFFSFPQGSLIASMALGIIILKKRYSLSKYMSIALVSMGIFTCTFMSAKQVASDSSLNEEDGLHVFLWWLLGLILGHHALPLPGFVLLAPNIYHHAVLFSQSEPFQIPVIGLTMPIMWFYLLMNVITQYVCIRGVFILTTECTSLTVTLVVTLRKFVSLIFSILYFRNPFTAWHWLGTAFVFVGTLMYTEVWNSLGPLLARWRKRPKEE